ncbi:MAG: hypothetical protein JOZ54_05395 [Acidobacteria bacterium]|nr:hypothetical protein [Acidobacteriota bacterium]
MLRASLALLAVMLASTLQAQQLLVKSYGQELVDQTLAKHPEVLVVVMHVATTDAKAYPIIASNIGRIGKPADDDDMRVVTTGESNLEVAHGGQRFEVEIAMHDVAGETIGALGLVFPYRNGVDKNLLEKKGIAIRDWLASRTLNAASLAEPHPYQPLATTKTHAQKLLDATLARHRDIIALAMHVTPPDASDNIIIASNFGRIGKKGDADDMKVVDAGTPIVGVYAAGKRYGVELPLHDASAKIIGALSVGFRYIKGDDEKRNLANATKIRDELAKATPSIESLTELDP